MNRAVISVFHSAVKMIILLNQEIEGFIKKSWEPGPDFSASTGNGNDFFLKSSKYVPAFVSKFPGIVASFFSRPKKSFRIYL
jgi:hypothetical protein